MIVGETTILGNTQIDKVKKKKNSKKHVFSLKLHNFKKRKELKHLEIV